MWSRLWCGAGSGVNQAGVECGADCGYGTGCCSSETEQLLSELKIRVQPSAKNPKNCVDQKTGKKSKAMQRNVSGKEAFSIQHKHNLLGLRGWRQVRNILATGKHSPAVQERRRKGPWERRIAASSVHRVRKEQPWKC